MPWNEHLQALSARLAPARTAIMAGGRLRIAVACWCIAAIWMGGAGGAGGAGAGSTGSAVEEGWCGHEGCECLRGKWERFERASAATGGVSESGLAAGAFDESTGRDLRNYPPDRVVDYLHMKLEMKFPTIDGQRFDAVQTLTLTPIGPATRSIRLDAIGLQIHSVKLGGKAIEHSQDDTGLSLRFDPPLDSGSKYDLVIEYACEQPYDGMTFTPSSSAVPAYSAEVHTQGQTDTNKHWFPCHDFPNERLTTELIVDVPAEYSVSSNGKLVSNLTAGDRSIWHWRQDKPHVAYLVSLVIGKFDVVKLPHARVPMSIWAPVGRGGDAMRTYGRTGEMIDLFEKRLGVPYPWERYDQLIVKNFRAGGMENTSATTMYPTAIFDETALLDGDLDGLISHELCHQWTGDLITCKSWAHIWLNEGWATYGSALWNEQRYGEDGYLESIRGNFGVAQGDRTTNDIGMVSPVYGTPFETFRRAANPYPKGSSILHMLRMMLGEEVFWQGVHLYMNRHAGGLAETSDFRYAMEEVSGLGLEWFFDQWCHRPGTPELDVTVDYQAGTRELRIDIVQKQKIDALTPAFRFVLPVHVVTATGARTFPIDVREKTTSFRTVLDGSETPRIIAVDPDLHVLKTITEHKPLSLWLAQAAPGSPAPGTSADSGGGPTIAARLDAIEALGKHDAPEVIALLQAIMLDGGLDGGGSERVSVRNAAVSALDGFSSAQAQSALLAALEDGVIVEEAAPGSGGGPRGGGGGGSGGARVRTAIVNTLRTCERAEALPRLARIAETDPSYACRVAALEGLAHHKATEHADLILTLVEFPSQHDQVRNAALRALADLDDARGLDAAIRYSAYGWMDRARPVAIEMIGRLAKHDQERAVTTLLPLLQHDPEWRSVEAAGAALARIDDARAVDPIRAMSHTHRDPELRKKAQAWLEEMEKK